ncbi:unnamed protein product [Cylicocyclus nassatus]|uniref:Tyrosine-protein kinase n=1 Tax=Cylicocyclus nassatus TaxID=53992 RepID=A0AA36H137_CYLNA|nr:unnamed protein product [Cylicocyclus nassatus]
MPEAHREIHVEDFDPTLRKHEYFHGLLPREDAVSLLVKNGDFLVRLSEAEGSNIKTVLSVLHDPKLRCKGATPQAREEFVVHIIIEYDKKKYYIVSDYGFNSVPELIHFYLSRPIQFKSQLIRLRQSIGLATWEFKAENIMLEAVVAGLTIGDVRKGKIYVQGQQPLVVAVKTIPGRTMEARQKVLELMRECRLLRNLSHPCVTQFYGVCLMAQPHCFILEYVAGGALDAHLRENKGAIKRDDLLMMVSCAGWGLEYLHQKSILHRDIAAKNCLCDRQFVKLIGFSMSKRGTFYTIRSATRVALRWMPPETLTKFYYTQKSDVYCFGILIYEIFSASEPYEGLSSFDAKALITEGVLNGFTGNTPKKLSEVVRDKMWAKQEDSRSAMRQIMLWLRVYTGMELQITNAGDVSSLIIYFRFSIPLSCSVVHVITYEVHTHRSD